tara:strand:+ start:280 stop:501 length:222 start_codon:yes stop_codon:yes gene_type:complete
LEHPVLLAHEDAEHDFIQHTALITPHVKTTTKINFNAESNFSLQLISQFILILPLSLFKIKPYKITYLFTNNY